MSARASMLRRAQAAWGEALPDWVEALALACDDKTQKAVARTTGYSAATLSYVLSRTYPGDLSKVEAAIRGALMSSVTD